MMVTGGLGGLGLIASFHCAAEYDNPIITTSRSGRLGSGGAAAMNLFEALKELVPVYNVRLDAGNAKDTADVFAWLTRPGMPPEDSKILIDDVVHQVKYKLHSLPDDALRTIQEFLLEVQAKIHSVMQDMKKKETKIDSAAMADLRDKDAQVSYAVSLIASKVGPVGRSGRCALMGGQGTGSYSVPDKGSVVPVTAPGQVELEQPLDHREVLDQMMSEVKAAKDDSISKSELSEAMKQQLEQQSS
eukprot:TRINITY_DN14244_c4_g1_i1.p1 TRINITY_DN14244_c4_g1~~TRINITY_DN14244_c4_g1_i1.p1  ORF type:complete len:245 (-),score=55.73 TRINITY_DN14244_c4_g1_i1:158-892(-)